MIVQKLLALSLLIISLLFFNNGTQAAPSTNLKMTVTPMRCNIEVVNDGVQSVAYIETEACQKALNKVYPDIEIIRS